jgi:hypothetical protein
VADKLPSTPSRREPAGLGGRLVLAAAAALLSARIGHDVRAAASKRVPPTAAATAEDTVALRPAAASART